jgi:hypothetical protein
MVVIGVSNPVIIALIAPLINSTAFPRFSCAAELSRIAVISGSMFEVEHDSVQGEENTH